MPKKKNFFSVVYEITDSQEFKSVSAELTDSLANDTILKGGRVVACGIGDYGTAHDAFQQYIIDQGADPDDVLREYLRDTENLKGEKLEAAVKAITG